MSCMDHARSLRVTLTAVAVCASLMGTAGCEMEVGPDYPGGGYLDYPPDSYIATTEPWYYDGRANYWYGGQWYYRNGGGWGHYHGEPAGLRARRMQGAQRRHPYEQYGGHAAFHGGGGRGGGRGGGHR